MTTMVDEVDAPGQDALSPVSTMTMGEFPDPSSGPEGSRAASTADRRKSAEDLLAEARERLGVHNVPATPNTPATPREELLADARDVLGSAATPKSPGVEEILAEARGAMGVSHVEAPRTPGAMGAAPSPAATPKTPSTPIEQEREAAGVHDVVHPALRGRASPGPLSPDESVEVELDEVEDEVDLDAHLPSTKGPAKKRVAFAKVNPAPLSPLSLPESSVAAGPRESLLSPRSDDEETLETFDEEGEAPPKRSLLSKSAGRPLKSPRAATPTHNNDAAAHNPPQKVVDLIPDDESEASLLVLMRYMGCTPIAYGDGPSLNLRAQHKMADPTGREFQFTFEEDDSNTILSDEGTYRTYEEDTVLSSVPHEDTLLSLEGAETVPSVPQEEEEEGVEEGVEMGLDDLVPASPVTLQELAAKVGQKKKVSPKKAITPQRTNSMTDKKRPNLTVETEQKEKIQTLLGEVGKKEKAAPGTMSADALHAFLDGCSLDGTGEGSWYEAHGDKRPEGVVSPNTALGMAAAAVDKTAPKSPALAALQKCATEDPKPVKAPSSALERYRNATPKAARKNVAKKEAKGVARKEADKKAATSEEVTAKTVADPAKKKKQKVVVKKNLAVETKPLADNLSPTSTSSEPKAAEGEPKEESAAELHRPTTDAKIESLSQTALSPSVRQLASALSPKHGAAPDASSDGTPASAASSIQSDSTQLKKLMAGATAAATVGLKADPAAEEGESRDDVVKEAPSSRSDKENGPDSGAAGSRATASLTVDTSAAAPPPSVRSPTRESVREVDALLTKTRRWLVRHGEAQGMKQGSEGGRSVPTLATAADADRKVMGNITATAVPGENGTGSAAATPSLKEQLRQSTTAIDAAGTKETFSSTLSSTRGASANEAPKKSIMEQLDEIRAKQKEIEARQAAKGKQVAA